MSRYTTVQINMETKKRLLKFKEYARETYDEIINKLMSIVESIKEEEEEFTDETIRSIERGRKDIKKGKFYTTKQLLKELGVE
jgi:predicted transcriptional regulator